MPREAHALAYLEAVIRYVTAAGANINAENVRSAIEQGASDGEELTGASTCSTREGAAHIASSRLLISFEGLCGWASPSNSSISRNE